jgi:conjugative relaxase-like TrwC/TraI family protein
MLRIIPIANAKAAESYYAKSDGGYYLDQEEQRCEWVGKGARMLGLEGTPDFEQFKRLINGLDPHSGKKLTARLDDDRICGWDVNTHCAKGVTLALERGDTRIGEALWAATREAIADMESFATTRVRIGGGQEDRITGNLVGFAVEHHETRPAKDDKMPDPQRHVHVVLFNVTYDQEERRWKAVKFRPIMDLKKYFDRRFNLRFSRKLADLGYEIETTWKTDDKGRRKYKGWDIKGIPQTLKEKHSRRSAEIADLEKDIIREMKERDENAPDELSALARDKLGGTSRQRKRKDVTLADCRAYWDGKAMPEEAREVAGTIRRALKGENPRPEPKAADAVAYALSHIFERQSVAGFDELAVTAMERSMGAALPHDIEREQARQGVLRQGDQVTTRDVLAMEGRVIGFARDGRGACRPLGPGGAISLGGLSDDQKAVVQHIWESPDRVIMVEGDAGTGKTEAMKVTIPGVNRPGVFLAPSASASRGTLREKGFANADTIARFLIDEKFQNQAKDGFIYVDEAPLAGIRQIDQVFGIAKRINARVILQGDRKQHASVDRGNVFPVLEQFAGLPVARLTQVWRQKDEGYKAAVSAIAQGDILGGYDKLSELGWIHQTPVFDHNQPLVDAYMEAIRPKRPGGKKPDVLVVAPTHQEGEEITQALRARLKQENLIGKEDETFQTLRPLHWTEAERSDPGRYQGTEVVQFVKNSGKYKAGQRISADGFDPTKVKPEHFAVYARAELQVAKGDTLRITANGRDATGKHRLNNGALYQVRGFTKQGGIELANGWVLGKDFAHMANGLASTSHASQGATVDRVLIAFGAESKPAITAQTFYVAASRARERAEIFTNISPVVLRSVIQKGDPRRSATELLQPQRQTEKPKALPKARRFVQRVQETYRILRQRAADANQTPQRRREVGHAR